MSTIVQRTAGVGTGTERRPGPTKPAPPSKSAPLASQVRPSREQLLASLDVTLPQVEPPAAYGLAIALLAGWLTLIPLAYLALLAFVSWLVVWHSLQALLTFSQGPYFVFHLPMALLAAVLLLFLIKPVFFRRKFKEAAVLTLREEDEPLLFAFVTKLCALTGSTAPSLIEVDCEPNAAARFKGGLGGLFGGKLVLRIGLPLVAGLPLRQLAGVLAHEFGHFNQRGGMTGSYLIRRLTAFFAQIVFQRDRLDERLARLRRHPKPLFRAFYYPATALIESARGLLWLMLVLGQLLTCGVLRRMEYDADHAEANLAGVRGFIQTGKLMMFLQIAAQRARGDLASAWEQQRLADDLPAMVVANAKQLAEHRSDILKLLEEQKTGWMDTHPCHNDRVANVQRLGAEGVLSYDAKSRFLFRDFPGVCRSATGVFYRSVLDQKAACAKLVSTAELVSQRAVERKNHKALRRFFRNQISALRPVFPGPDAFLPADDVRACAQMLVAARQQMLAAAETAGPLVEQLETAVPALAVARAQTALCQAFTGRPRAAGVWVKAQREVHRQEPIRANALSMLAAFEEVAQRRLTLALRLLHNDSIARRVPDGGRARQSAAQLTAACTALQPCMPAITRLQELSVDIRVLYGSYDAKQPFRPLVTRVLAATGEAAGLLRTLQGDLALAPYPFEHANDRISIGGMLVPRLPSVQDPADVHACVAGVVERYYNMLFRALAALTNWAESVETAVGLPTLPEPPERESKSTDAGNDRRNTRRYWLGYGGRAVAGVALLVGVIWLSMSPPTISVPWGTQSVGGYKPNSFHVALRQNAPPAGFGPDAPTTPDIVGPFGTFVRVHPPVPNIPIGRSGPNHGPHVPNIGPFGPGRQNWPQAPNPAGDAPVFYHPPAFTPPSPPSFPAQPIRTPRPAPFTPPSIAPYQPPMPPPTPYHPPTPTPPPTQYHPPTPPTPPTPPGPPPGRGGGHH